MLELPYANHTRCLDANNNENGPQCTILQICVCNVPRTSVARDGFNPQAANPAAATDTAVCWIKTALSNVAPSVLPFAALRGRCLCHRCNLHKTESTREEKKETFCLSSSHLLLCKQYSCLYFGLIITIWLPRWFSGSLDTLLTDTWEVRSIPGELFFSSTIPRCVCARALPSHILWTSTPFSYVGRRSNRVHTGRRKSTLTHAMI